jgi:integrase
VANVKLPGLKIYQVNGKWYAYVRETGVALIKNFDGTKKQLLKRLAEPDMLGAYNVRRPQGPRTYAEHTLGWLVKWFTDPEQCLHFKKLSEATADDYRKTLACLEEVYDAPLKELKTSDVVAWRDKVEKDKWPAFSDKMITALSTAFGLAVERGWMDANIAKSIRRTYKSDKHANREWLPEEWTTVMGLAPMHLKIAFMLARYVGYRSQSIVRVDWTNYKPNNRFGMCFRMRHKKNDEEHWLPASPELQAFLAELKFGDATGKIAVRYNGQPWQSEEQLQKQSSNFLTGLARKGIVGSGLTEHGLRATFSCEIKRETGATDEEIASALGDRDPRMGAHYTRHVEQEKRIIELFFAKQLRTGVVRKLSKRRAQLRQNVETGSKIKLITSKGGL